MTSPAVFVILAACILVFLFQGVAPEWLVGTFALWPAGAGYEPWQLITYAFLHANLLHIVVNMWALILFGPILERVWGSAQFVSYYFVAVVAAAVTQLMVLQYTAQVVPTGGASGGMFGLLLAFAFLFPEEKLYLIFLPVGIPARWFALGYAALELTLGVVFSDTGIAHFAHLGGMAGGLIYLLAMRGRWW
jgi:membrane associated rhomboid family serine protease